MPDPLDRVSDEALRSQLAKIRAWNGEILASSSLRSGVLGFQSQRGIYKPAASEYALWVRQTSKAVYSDDEPRTRPDGSWIYRYAPENRGEKPDLTLATNRALLKCISDGVPVGVFRQVSPSGREGRYEVLGLAYVTGFDGSHFVLEGEPIDWTRRPVPQNVVVRFEPFEAPDPTHESVSRTVRDQRFAVAIRRAYHDRCSLCEVGYRLRGRSLALEAAHIIPVESRGVISDVRNGVLLCRNHHALFDGFAWTIDEDLRVVVSDDRDFRSSAAANHVLKYEGQRMGNLPSIEEDLPAPEALRWRLNAFATT